MLERLVSKLLHTQELTKVIICFQFITTPRSLCPPLGPAKFTEILDRGEEGGELS